MAPTMDLTPQVRFELLTGRRLGLMRPWAKVLTNFLINLGACVGFSVVAKMVRRFWSACAMVEHNSDKSNFE